MTFLSNTVDTSHVYLGDHENFLFTGQLLVILLVLPLLHTNVFFFSVFMLLQKMENIYEGRGREDVKVRG